MPSALDAVGCAAGRQPVKTEWWGAGVVICLERGADLHMAQLMPLPLTVSCFSKIQIGLTFWHQLTWVVPDKGLLNGCVSESVFIYGAAYQKSQSAVFMLPKKVPLQLSSEQSVGDVGITQLDWKRVPQARSCTSSVAITYTVCVWTTIRKSHASLSTVDTTAPREHC